MPPFSIPRAHRWAWYATALIAAALCVSTLSPVMPAIGPPSSDKIQHFIGFAALASPLGFAYPRRTLAIVAAATLFGAGIELVQPFVGRSAELADLVADALGATTGALAMRALRR